MSTTRIAVAGAAAVCAHGLDYRGLFAAIRDKRLTFAPSRELADSFPGTLASEVPPIAPSDDAGDARARKLMSRPARFAAIAMRKAIDDAGWRESDRSDVGCFMGVGASGVAMNELPPLLSASLDENGLDLAKFGRDGLNAINPLFAFQTMNNFTLCHGAIVEGLGGPNAAFFSRGDGTVTALREAIAALDDGSCTRALAGAADSAVHPVTWSDLGGRVVVPGEGAAFLALASKCERPLAFVTACPRIPSLVERRRLIELLRAVPAPDVLIVAGSNAGWLRYIVGLAIGDAPIVDLGASLGGALAATPALGWVAAVDAIAAGAARSVCALTCDHDGPTTMIRFEAPDA